MSEPREPLSYEAGDPGLMSPFIDCPATDSHRSGDRRVTIGLRSRFSVAAVLGFGLFASAVVTHLVFLRRAKRHLGF